MRTALYLVSISVILLAFFINMYVINLVETGNRHYIVTMPKIDRDLSSYGISCELGLFNKLVHVDTFVDNNNWVKIHSSGSSLLRDAEKEEILLWNGNLTKVVIWVGTPAREPIFWITRQRSCNAKKVNDTFLVDIESGSTLFLKFNGPILLQTNELNVSYNTNEAVVSGRGWSSLIPAEKVNEIQLIFGNNITIYLNKNIMTTVEASISKITWMKITGNFSEIGALRGAFQWTNS
ncbi:MAG: hypothetical protein ACPL09_06275 [Candidatus Methanodesulfokora sp.]